MKRIESRLNSIIKSVSALSERSERAERGLFFFEGVHLLEEYLASGRRPYAVFVREDVTNRYSELLATLDREVYEVPDFVYSKLSAERAPQGILTVVRFLDNIVPLSGTEEEIASICSPEGNIVLLDGLQDPGNVGTVIRTAAALGVKVILSSCADIYSSKTVRATMGAMFRQKIMTCNDSVHVIKALRSAGRRVVAAAVYGDNRELGRFEILPDDCFVIGNEGNGLSESVLSECDLSARIPMTDMAESFNAGVAAAIFLWEARRGRT